MREFFRGWKRKLGVVTLVLACVFAAGWVRSLSVCDQFSMPLRKHHHVYFASLNQTLFWSQDESPAPYPTLGAYALPKAAWDDWAHAGEWDEVEWTWRRFGFAIGERTIQYGPSPLKKVLAVAFPYWSIVIPPTFLSAWLLLSKPRPAKQTAPSMTTAT